MNYELALEYYKGPLDKLLELIEGEKLEITQVSLAKVTGDFLLYVQTLKIGIIEHADRESGEVSQGTDPQLVADFLVIASKLLLIKSKALLPSLEVTGEEETEMKDLENRLKLYQELKRAQQFIKEGWHEFPVSWAREFLQTTEPLFYPPTTVTPETIYKTVLGIAGELEKFFKPTLGIKNEIINLKAKIEEVLKRLTKEPMDFKHLQRGVGRSEIVVLFLAILHLIKDQLISVEQQGHFSEMTIVKRPASM